MRRCATKKGNRNSGVRGVFATCCRELPTFDEPWLQDLLPSMQTLHICATPQPRSNLLPATSRKSTRSYKQQSLSFVRVSLVIAPLRQIKLTLRLLDATGHLRLLSTFPLKPYAFQMRLCLKALSYWSEDPWIEGLAILEGFDPNQKCQIEGYWQDRSLPEVCLCCGRSTRPLPPRGPRVGMVAL